MFPVKNIHARKNYLINNVPNLKVSYISCIPLPPIATLPEVSQEIFDAIMIQNYAKYNF